ncbi:hypothetical protein SD71_13795 [Cohnella kolymensis]|uniref:Polysaccharide biosynthesis protein C-terminal domain-containing protein n=1 Tax=Cohnella kolymensis TaxID=1590652 RepID=A0ABR5A2U6_9BACL|nr:hypothetical protein [Cohnella kolymensis]KIL35383.1 hypothetical protein SD71_13795 [Cohnella kolymensis]
MKSRRTAAVKNIIVITIYQLFTIILGFIIPKLFLTTYGPSIHGLTSSITNIMNYVLLLNAGLNIASTQSLYEPLSQNNIKRINEVLNAIKLYYYNTGIVLFIVITIIATILPVLINDVPRETVFWLMLVMGLQTTLDCFLLSKYRVLLQADQKLYISFIFSIIVLVLRGTIQIVLISNNYSVVAVQSIPALLQLITMLLQNMYVRYYYPMLDGKVKPDKTALAKRWSAFVHQISGLIVNNKDILLLTTTGNMILVSIYSVYQLVFSQLYNLMTTVFSQGSVAGFGHLLASGSKESLRSNYSTYEYIYFIFISIVYSITAIMILPFVNLFTAGVEDVYYVDPKLAVLFIIIGMLNNFRVPGVTLINAGGYYKETQWRAITEALINLSSSLVFMQFMGVYGILLGTVVSFIYRTIDTLIFSNKHILNQSPNHSILRSLRVIAVVVCSIIFFSFCFSN